MNRTPALPMTPEQRATLHGWIRAGTTAQRVVLRSRIVLLAADGLPSKHIAHQLATSQDTVRLWRRRFTVGGPGTLTRDAPGRGRKRHVTAAREQQVVEATLHTAPPRATHWSLRTMAAAHLGGHLKTGHRSTLQNRPPRTWRARRSEFYRRPALDRKSVCSLVRQLRGPHLSMCAWWRSRSRSAVTAAVSPRSFPQSSTGLFDVSSVDARS